MPSPQETTATDLSSVWMTHTHGIGIAVKPGLVQNDVPDVLKGVQYTSMPGGIMGNPNCWRTPAREGLGMNPFNSTSLPQRHMFKQQEALVHTTDMSATSMDTVLKIQENASVSASLSDSGNNQRAAQDISR